MRTSENKPGVLWPLVLGVTGFAAGFIGPMIFTPEANQGPLVGILMSGPAGLLAGALLLGICRLLRVPARIQWLLLIAAAAVGAAVVLVMVLPQPALRGYILTLRVRDCIKPIDREEQILDYWAGRIAAAPWASPAPAWRDTIHRVLKDGEGVLIDVDVEHEISVWERRKPWDRGSLFTTAGRNAPPESSFYISHASCADLPRSRELRLFESYGSSGVPGPANRWPPGDMIGIVNASPMTAVPARYANLQ